MTVPKPPFYVSFSHDRIPQTVDHSRVNPGPPGGAANRAGHTSIRPKGRVSFAWDQLHVGPDRRIPIFAQSINVYFWLTDFAVAISSDFTERSCAYQATRRHEFQAHIYAPIRIFHSYRDILIQRLNVIDAPTRTTPFRAATIAETNARQAQIEAQVKAVAWQVSVELNRDLQAARVEADDARHYRLVYRQCTDAEWANGP